VQSTMPPPPPTCTFSINPTSANFSSSGGAGSITVTTTDGCAYTAQPSSDSAFVTIANQNGAGSGTINFTVDTNGTGAARTGSIFVGGQIFTVNQSAAGVRRKKILLSPTQ